jgi:DNA-binding PadR family transcriptional regulator
MKETKEKGLTRNEEVILLSILKLRQDAYLVAIVDHISQITGKKTSVATIYFPLSRLEEQGVVSSRFGEATAVRGGRRKKIYSVTELGFRLLEEHKRVSDLLWREFVNGHTSDWD